MKLNATNGKLHTVIELPTSKSISNRALIINAISYSNYPIDNLSESNDTKVLKEALNSDSNSFDVGAAGTSMRFLTAFLSKTVGEWEITGSERMKQRPIKILVEALNSLGAKIEYLEKEGFPPLKIVGNAMLGGEIKIAGGVSSQYISALMMIAPYMINGLKIELTGEVVSIPYIYMTKRIMEKYGANVKIENNNIIYIPFQSYTPTHFTVEADWSAASYWYQILSILGCGTIKLKNLDKNSIQGDSKVAEIFKLLGIHTEYISDGIIISQEPLFDLSEKEKLKTETLKLDFLDTPDLAQTLVTTCCAKGIKFEFSGLQSLRIKETNRIEALITELKKVGFVLREVGNGGIEWDGERCTPADTPTISTYEDHRMAMAFAPFALITPIEIEDPEVVNKSYPNFWKDIEKSQIIDITY